MNRRHLLTMAAASAVFSSVAVSAQDRPRQLKPLPFDPAKLRGLSDKNLNSHHQNNYTGAFRRLEQIEKSIAGLPKDAPGYMIRGLRMEELIATNSVILHEEYFGNLGGDGKASGSLAQAIARQFGSVDAWEQEFRAMSTALGGGSGWVVLNLNFRDGRLHNYISFDHTDNVAFGRPVLVNDMFEHSYHIDFGSRAAAYVDAFMANVNWEECSRRFDEGTRMAALLK